MAIPIYPQQPAIEPKIRFSWIGEAWQLNVAQMGVWALSIFIVIIIGGVIGAIVSLPLRATGLTPTPTPGTPFADIMRQAYLSPGQAINQVVSFLTGAFFACGLFKMAVNQVRGQDISIGMLFSNLSLFPRMLVYYLIYQLTFLIPVALGAASGLMRHDWVDAGIGAAVGAFIAGFILPMYLPGFALIADGLSVGEALATSFKAVSQDWLTAFFFGIVFGFCSVIGFVLCCVGACFTLPIFNIVPALMYRDMIGMPMPPAPAFGSLQAASAAAVWPPAPGPSYPQPPPAYPQPEPQPPFSNDHQAPNDPPGPTQ